MGRRIRPSYLTETCGQVYILHVADASDCAIATLQVARQLRGSDFLAGSR